MAIQTIPVTENDTSLLTVVHLVNETMELFKCYEVLHCTEIKFEKY